MLLNIFGFLIILAPLVIAHEFGHYIFARIFGVKAEVFSIGFGKKLWSRQMGETELRVSMLPLGGYVKLLGEDREATLSAEDQKRALHRQAPWKRFFIFFGGPLFNFAFAILIFMVILAVGEPRISNLIGRVIHDSAAAKAGFVSGDRITAVQGKSTSRYDDIMDVVSENPGNPLRFDVIHPDAKTPVELVATPSSEPGYSLYGEPKQVGDIDGLVPSPLSPKVGISDPKSPAGRAGVRTGDTITEINGTPVKSFEDVERLYAAVPAGSQVGIRLGRADAEAAKAATSTFQISLAKPAGHKLPELNESMGEAWGLYSSEMFIDKVVDGSPAQKAGIRVGDRIIDIDGKPVYSFFDMKDGIEASGEKSGKVEIRWEHEGKTVSASITPNATAGRNDLGKKITSYTVGVGPMLEMVEPEMKVERIWNPFALVYQGTERMAVFTWRNFVSIFKIATGELSVATLGGPIMIGKIAGESLARGLISFLTNMAFLSVGLGVLNVLPIPVLDGGHLLLLAVETVRGKPLALRTMEIIQSIGLTAILVIMFVVFRNDITRLIP